MDDALPRDWTAGKPQENTDATGPTRVKALFEAHYDLVWRVLRRLGLSAASADDAAQEVFILAAQKWMQIRPGSEKPFLLGVARRIAASSRRKVPKTTDSLDDKHVEALKDGALLPEQMLRLAEERRMLEEIMNEMDDDTREVFVLFELESLSRSQVAEVLGIPEGTAASRMRRAQQQFLAEAARLKHRLARERGRP